MPEDAQQPSRLKRELGVFHAVLLGLGSILGTGVFVSIGIAAGIAGPSVLIAIVLAALLALCNGLSSAQLAAAHPVAGGTYEYGYKFLHPKFGFTAGWMFLLAKSASAATAALGVSYYLHTQFFIFTPIFLPRMNILLGENGKTMFAVGFVCLTTILVLVGLRRSSIANVILVLITLVGLTLVIVSSFFEDRAGFIYEPEKMRNGFGGLLTSTALLFVAYTGYGRVATLGEEVVEPRKTIPVAILLTLLFTGILYFFVAMSMAYSIRYHQIILDQDSVLMRMVRSNGAPEWFSVIVSIAAITAMLGVLLNLILGLSRVLLAMGRRHDVPGFFKSVNASGTTPVPAVIGVGVLIAGLTLIGDVKTTWSFSAFTVLIYYGITNLAALRLPKKNRLYPRVFSYVGLAGCFFLCWWVEPVIWLVGLGLIAAGLVWHTLAPKWFGAPPRPDEVCTQCGYDLRASTGSCPECGQVIVRYAD